MAERNIPDILNQKPDPKVELKTFHKTKLLGWSGCVKIKKIHGWADNRRIELFRRQCSEQFGRVPTDDEIYNYMLSEKDFHIRELARSILYNGVRVPIILAADGTLLDGNRRYVATRYAMEHNPDSKDELDNIPTWVLTEDASDEDKRKVLVECNFLDDWKVEWPNYIRAITIYDDYTDNGLTLDDISVRYDRKKTEIRKILKVMDLIQEFCNFNNNSDEAIRVAYEHYPFFEEAHNKFRAKLDSDPDFKDQFFTWMIEGKFRSMMQVRRLGEIRDNEDAWAVIRSDNPDAVDTAIHIVQGEKLPDTIGGEKKIKRIIRQLEKLNEQEIASIGPGVLGELEILLFQIITMSKAVREAKKEKADEGETKTTSG